MDFQFQRDRIDKIPRTKIVEELKKVAKIFNYTEFCAKDFDKISEISSHTVIREFGSWKKSLVFLAKTLMLDNIELKPKPRKRKHYSNRELFDEMERIWKELGHRPSVGEWEKLNPKISSNTYMRYFGGWQNACLKFIEYKMGSNISADDFVLPTRKKPKTQQKHEVEYKKENSRNISLSLRLAVLNRDNFRCVICGRSPAMDIGVRLHLDHITPFSKGGKSVIENLQTLCQDCNLGKSDKILINKVNNPPDRDGSVRRPKTSRISP